MQEYPGYRSQCPRASYYWHSWSRKFQQLEIKRVKSLRYRHPCYWYPAWSLKADSGIFGTSSKRKNSVCSSSEQNRSLLRMGSFQWFLLIRVLKKTDKRIFQWLQNKIRPSYPAAQRKGIQCLLVLGKLRPWWLYISRPYFRYYWGGNPRYSRQHCELLSHHQIHHQKNKNQERPLQMHRNGS